MGYVALYREWRPQLFSDIIGQEHITRTLKNAIKTNRIAHAYLFCGPRGTGKTTTAKVLAKALNCIDESDIEPCNNCKNCKSINEGYSMDVIEIDAASNRGIDEIRDLREKVQFAPTEGKYRIYIIDEVHMLTTEAFNALLKTLEEPPAHVVFMLATTEPHKIPLTILSRCQRFDFRRIGFIDITNRLKTVVDDLGIKAEEEALALIAKTAEGGMRDALSILDQCISFGENQVTIEDVNAVLGTVDTEFLFNMADCFYKKDVTMCLKIVNELVQQGKDIHQFTKDLIYFFRNLLLIYVCDDDINEIVLVPEDKLNIMKKLALDLDKSMIIKFIEVFTSVERDMRWTSQPRLLLELGVIKAADLSEYSAEKKLPEPSSQNNRVNNDNWPYNIDMETVKNCWNEILERIKKVKMSARAFLIEGKPVNVAEGTLLLSFPPEYKFHKERVEQKENREAIEHVIKEITGVNLKIKCKFENELLNNSISDNNNDDDNALVDEAVKIFGAKVIEIKD